LTLILFLIDYLALIMAKIITSHKTYLAKTGDLKREWHVIDASGKILGRLAVKIADLLRGKQKPTYTPHIDTGDFVIVINASKIALSGQKMDKKTYNRFSPYGNRWDIPIKTLLEKTPDKVLFLAVKRMLTTSRLNKHLLTKLKIYPGAEHPHQAQMPKALDIKI